MSSIKSNLIFTHGSTKTEEQPSNTYFEDTAKAIGESKVAIDSYAEERGGDKCSEQFQGTDKKITNPLLFGSDTTG